MPPVPPPDTGLQLIDYIAVGGYLAVTAGIVVWSVRKQSSTEDFFLGGRRMPWLAVGLSLMATLMSTISYLAVPGEMIKNGVTMFIGYLSVPLSMAVVLCLWIPFFMRLRMTSAYEYLERRFDYRARFLAGSLFLMLRLGWMSLVIFVASLALARMTGESLSEIVGVVGIAATIYTCVGGIRAVIWTDVLQFIMLLGGVLITLGYIAWATGTGPGHWWSTVAAGQTTHVEVQLFSLDPTVRMTVVTIVLQYFFWTICTHGSDQVVLQRYFSTTSLGAARRSYIVNAVCDLSIGLLLALSGLALMSFYLERPGYLAGTSLQQLGDQVLPHFYACQLPAGLGGLMLASFLCDAMQTLDSGVNSITAVATTDLFNRLWPNRRRRLSELNFARAVALVVGLLVTALAYGVAYNFEQSNRNIVDLMPRVFNMFLGPLASLFFIGMFLPRCTARSAVPAVLLGLAVAILWSHWGAIPRALAAVGLADASTWWGGLLGKSDGQPKTPSISLAIALPCLASFLTAALLGIVAERGGDHPGRRYTWLAVMRRAKEI